MAFAAACPREPGLPREPEPPQLAFGRFSAVVWDFDLTVLRRHAFADRVEPDQVRLADFSDADGFRSVVRKLVRDGVKVGIASFGRYEVIQAYLDLCFATRDADAGQPQPQACPFNRSNVLTPSVLGGRSRDGCVVVGGKVPMLDRFLRLNCGVDSEDPEAMRRARLQLAFFDDRVTNVVGARKHGYHFAFACKEPWTKASSWRELHAWALQEVPDERLIERAQRAQQAGRAGRAGRAEQRMPSLS